MVVFDVLSVLGVLSVFGLSELLAKLAQVSPRLKGQSESLQVLKMKRMMTSTVHLVQGRQRRSVG